MGLDRKMDDNERGLFTFHSLIGFTIAVVVLLTILVVLTINSIQVQKDNAEVYYEINQDLNGLKQISPENHTMRTIK